MISLVEIVPVIRDMEREKKHIQIHKVNQSSFFVVQFSLVENQDIPPILISTRTLNPEFKICLKLQIKGLYPTWKK